MSFLFIFFVINSAFASESSYSLLDHFNTLSVQQRDCPPLFYGPRCTIPHCFAPHGVLMQNGDYYYCNCTTGRPYVTGTHCENIECQNDGRFSNLTSKCKCPEYTYGSFCQYTLLHVIAFILVCSCCVVALCVLPENSPCRKHWPSIRQKLTCTPSESYRNPAQTRDYFKFPRYICERTQHYWRTIQERFQHYRSRITLRIRNIFTRTPNEDSTTPAPEVRIVERIVYRDCNEHHDAPPTYLTAMYSELPKYETATDPAGPPKYTD
uniref:EGF-like domain-containing protein n=1 Tax=Panagrellus redivivus TaxID=6233 RepID=A0A7E4VB38_PANRE